MALKKSETIIHKIPIGYQAIQIWESPHSVGHSHTQKKKEKEKRRKSQLKK